MKTLFSYKDFINENINSTDWLLQQPYIIKDQKTQELKVISAKTKNFPESLYKKNLMTYTTLNYNSLFKFMLLSWLYKYNGNNDILINIKTNLINNNVDNNVKNYIDISNNKTISTELKNIICDITLSKIIHYKNHIFTEENILNFYHIVNDNNMILNDTKTKIKNYLYDPLNKTQKSLASVLNLTKSNFYIKNVKKMTFFF